MSFWRSYLSGGGRTFERSAFLLFILLALGLAWPLEAPGADTWSETEPMATARYSHTATRLADGRILVAGGGGEHGGYLDRAELFDPVTGRWSATGPLREARSGHTATLLNDGRVLVAGGRNVSGAIEIAEVYDLATGVWSDTGSLSNRRFFHTATLLNDGRVLVVGGALTSIELYNPATETWTRSSMDIARFDQTATLLNDGQVLVAGGVDNSDPYNEAVYLDNADIYNPADGTWRAPDPLVGGRARHTATLLNDGRVLVMGGWNPGVGYLESAKLFDPATGTWSNTDSLPYDGFEYHTATLLNDGRVLVAGGNRNAFAQSLVELFNPATGSWTVASYLENQRYWHTATLLCDGRVLVTGGAGPGALASAEIFDPKNYLKNGSFERASVDPGAVFGKVISMVVGNTDITHWTVGDGGLKYREDWRAAEGRRSLDLNRLEAGSISQIFYTPMRTRFLVTFAMAGNPEGIQGVKTLRVSQGNQSQDFTFDTTGRSPNNMGWTTKSFQFTSNGILPISGVEFKSLTPGQYGPAIDKVRVIQFTLTPVGMLQLLLE